MVRYAAVKTISAVFGRVAQLKKEYAGIFKPAEY